MKKVASWLPWSIKKKLMHAKRAYVLIYVIILFLPMNIKQNSVSIFAFETCQMFSINVLL